MSGFMSVDTFECLLSQGTMAASQKKRHRFSLGSTGSGFKFEIAAMKLVTRPASAISLSLIVSLVHF